MPKRSVYALSRGTGLIRFVDDHRIEIDNNVVERSMPVPSKTLSSPDGDGEHWAISASLIETCKLNAIEPQSYLSDVISPIVTGHPNSRKDELLPRFDDALALKAVA